MTFRFLLPTLRAGNRKRGAFEKGKRAVLLCKIEFIAFQGKETKMLKMAVFVSYPRGRNLFKGATVRRCGVSRRKNVSDVLGFTAQDRLKRNLH
jgi:hypothetical protein